MKPADLIRSDDARSAARGPPIIETMTPLEQLRRWEDSGGTWTVLRRSADGAVVALMRCDGGEIVDRLESADPALLAHIDAPGD
ncbi:hypothetical protein GCM10009648_02070 [Tsukamurella spumae]